MDGSYVLAVVQGTTGAKTLTVSGDGNVAGSASTEFPRYYPRARGHAREET